MLSTTELSSSQPSDDSSPELRGPKPLPVFSPTVQQATDDQRDVIKVTDAARIAIHDTPGAAPRVIIVEPSDIRTYIDTITVHVFNEAKQMGGKIAYMVIREAVENYIHAHFREPIVTILDNGNTIRFTDQGPGIANPELVTQPGITSATQEMKSFIRGSGSGLPIIKENLQISGGSLFIHPNVGAGACITLTLNTQAYEQSCHITQKHCPSNELFDNKPQPTTYQDRQLADNQYYNHQPHESQTQTFVQPAYSSMSNKGELHQDMYDILTVIKKYKSGGPTLIEKHCDMSLSTAHRRLNTLLEQGYLMKEKRSYVLSPRGYRLLDQLYR